MPPRTRYLTMALLSALVLLSATLGQLQTTPTIQAITDLQPGENHPAQAPDSTETTLLEMQQILDDAFWQEANAALEEGQSFIQQGQALADDYNARLEELKQAQPGL